MAEKSFPPTDEIICASSDEGRRASLAGVLDEAGYRVHVCATTRELLQLAARRSRVSNGERNVLLLDDELDGSFSASEILTAFKRSGIRLRTIILAPTGRADEIIECLRLGAADYIHVPARPAEILEVVRRVMELPSIR